MTFPWETKDDTPVATGDAVVDKQIQDEKERVKASIGEQPKAGEPQKVGPTFGKALEYFDDKTGKTKRYLGRGRRHEKVKAYYDGDLTACTVVQHTYEKPTETKKEGERKIPDKNTQEGQERWAASRELALQLYCGVLQPIYLERNNPMSDAEIRFSVIITTPALYKYYDYVEDNAEFLALANGAKVHMIHRRFIHPETGEVVDKQDFKEFVKQTNWKPDHSEAEETYKRIQKQLTEIKPM